MTTIYLVRHAEAEGNAYRRIHGQYDSLITPNGLRQIEALAKRSITCTNQSRSCANRWTPESFCIQLLRVVDWKKSTVFILDIAYHNPVRLAMFYLSYGITR